MSWKEVKLGEVIKESKISAEKPNPDKRIRVRLNLQGVEKRPLENEIEGATKQFIRKAGQFIYGKQNFHKGAFGIIPKELDGFETSADIPSFDVRDDCLSEWIYYYFKIGNRYLELEKIARGVGSKRIHPEQIYELMIPLPSIPQQLNLIDNFKGMEKCGFDVDTELAHQLDLVKQLRQSFLREAMQGKLVKQDSKDGNASDLLKEIKIEKAKLGKKEKPLSPIKNEEIPFEIPENWVWCRLGESGDLKRGKSKHRPRNDAILFEGGKYPFIQTGDVAKAKLNNDLITTINGYYNDFGLKQSEIQSKGTMCITIAANIAECGFLGFDACVPDSVVCFSALNRGIEKYVYYYMKIAKNELERFAPATAQKNINLGILNDLLIPLPPLSEQHRIVKKLEELMKYCDELEKNIQQSKSENEKLLQQVLREALSGEIK
ncbi:MAG TPA: restriction endonuclease subunit S [bacterium]|nr:restriction endonuclease subunit S [bacterium]HQN71883.1 restriction endonuclease subunit S [bacterium]